MSWEHCVPSDTVRALWGLGYCGCYSVLYIHCGYYVHFVSGVQHSTAPQLLYGTVTRALLLAAWLVPGEGASTAGKRSGNTPGWEVVKNGCEFAREASPPTLGQAAGMEVRPDSGTPLPAVREQTPPSLPGSTFYLREAAPSAGMNLEAGSSWVPLFLQTKDWVTLLLGIERVWEEQLSIHSATAQHHPGGLGFTLRDGQMCLLPLIFCPSRMKLPQLKPNLITMQVIFSMYPFWKTQGLGDN